MAWRKFLPELLASTSVRTQDDLVRALAKRGHPVTQGAVSRELKRLGVTKIEGAYRLPVRPEIGAPLHGFLTTAGDCLAIVLTDPAFASVISEAIDQGRIEGVLGTIAGDDTVFVATSGKAATRRLREFLGFGKAARKSTAA